MATRYRSAVSAIRDVEMGPEVESGEMWTVWVRLRMRLRIWRSGGRAEARSGGLGVEEEEDEDEVDEGDLDRGGDEVEEGCVDCSQVRIWLMQEMRWSSSEEQPRRPMIWVAVGRKLFLALTVSGRSCLPACWIRCSGGGRWWACVVGCRRCVMRGRG